MKKLFVVLGAVIASTAILAVPLCSCQGEISFTTATLSDVKMATSVDPTTMEPIYVQGEMEVTDFLLYEDMIAYGGDGDIAFSLETDGDYLWPTGDYKVILYVDDKESTSIDFTVE